MYKNILFDLDGTILDTTEGVIEAVKITINELKLQMPDASTLKTFVGPTMQSSFEKHFKQDKQTALKNANLFRKNYKEHSLFIAKPYDGIIEILKYLKHNGFKVAVATNKSHQNAMDILKKFEIMQYLDYALGSDLEGKLTKTDIVNICIEKLNANKDETVLIGDSETDLKGAKQSDIDFIAVTWGFGFNKENCPNKYFTSPKSLLEYLKKEQLCLKN